MILMWLRAFGEYGTTVVLAYHPYSLPVYVDNLFSSAPLSQTEAPTILAFAVVVVAVAVLHLPRPPRLWRRRVPMPEAPVPTSPTPVGFDLDATARDFPPPRVAPGATATGWPSSDRQARASR